MKTIPRVVVVRVSLGGQGLEPGRPTLWFFPHIWGCSKVEILQRTKDFSLPWMKGDVAVVLQMLSSSLLIFLRFRLWGSGGCRGWTECFRSTVNDFSQVFVLEKLGLFHFHLIFSSLAVKPTALPSAVLRYWRNAYVGLRDMVSEHGGDELIVGLDNLSGLF